MMAAKSPFKSPVHVCGKTCLRHGYIYIPVSANSANMVLPATFTTETVMFPMFAGLRVSANSANSANIPTAG